MRYWHTLVVLCLFWVSATGCGGDDQEATGLSSEKPTATSAAKPPELPGGIAGAATQSAGGFWFVCQDDIAALVLRPAKALRNSLMKDLPRETVFGEMIEETGIEPEQIERLTIVVSSSMIPKPDTPAAGPNAPAVVFQFVNPVNAKDLSAKLLHGEVSERTHDGTPYFVRPIPEDTPAELRAVMESMAAIAGCGLDERTFFIGRESNLKAILSRKKGSSSRLGAALASLGTGDEAVAVALMEPIKDRIKDLIAQGQQSVPPPLAPLLALPDLAKSAVAQVNLTGQDLIKITFDAYDANAAEQLEITLGGGLEIGKQALAGMGPQLSQSLPGDLGGPVLKLLTEFATGLAVSTQGQKVVLAAGRPAGLTAFANDIGPKIVQMAETAQQEAVGKNNLRQIALAVHNYHDVNNKFPANVRDANGQVLLSWRVLLLPYLEAGDLHNQLKLDQPWDGPDNRALVEKMPEVFNTAGTPNDGTTRFLAFAGENTPFGSDENLAFRNIVDGTSNTIMFVQCGPDKAQPWSKPEDLPFDPQNPIAALGTISGPTFMTSMLDGFVRSIRTSIDKETLRRLILYNDGQIVDSFE